MALILPARYSQQPQCPVEIDWSHPLARGLVFFQIPSMAGSPDLVGGGRPTILSGTGMKAGAGGVGASVTNTSSQGWGTAYRNSLFRTMTTEFTVATHVDIDAFTTNSKILCVPYHNASWSDPYITISLGRNGDSSAASLEISTDAGTVQAANFATDTFVAKSNVKYIGVRNGASSSLLINQTKYLPVSSNIGAANIGFGSGNTVNLMTRDAGLPGEGTAGTYYYAAVWNRALSDAEQQSFQASPYQILKPTRRLILSAKASLPPTRFYLPSTGTAPVDPAFDAEWDDSSSVIRRPLNTIKGTSPLVEVSDTEESTSNSWDVLLGQFISEPLAEQTLSGTFTCVIRPRDSAAAANARSQMCVKIVSNDGATIRATLCPPNTGTTNVNEWIGTTTATAARVRFFPNGTPSYTFPNTTVQQGDRIVVEVGGRAVNTVNTVFTLAMWLGESGAVDLPTDETSTTAGNPWIEFSNGLQFYTATAAQTVTASIQASKPTLAATTTQTLPAWSITAEIVASKPTITASAVKPAIGAQTVDAGLQASKPTVAGIITTSALSSSVFTSEFSYEFGGPVLGNAVVSTSLLSPKPSIAVTATHVFPPRDIAGTLNATKPAISASLTTTRRVSASLTVAMPAISATATQVFPARFVSGDIQATRPTASAAVGQVFPARSVVGQLAASRPTLGGAAIQQFPARFFTGSLSSVKPGIIGTATQVFPDRNILAAIQAAKPAIAATTTQEFPARSIAGGLSIQPPVLASAVVQEFPPRTLTASLQSPSPMIGATAFQAEIGSASVSSALVSPVPAVGATAAQIFPARTISATIAASKPVLAATVDQEYPTRTVAGALVASKPSLAAAATQTYPARSLTASIEASKPTIDSAAVQQFPTRFVSAGLSISQPTITAVVVQSAVGSLGISGTLPAPRPTIAATAAQVFPARDIVGSISVKKPIAAATVTHTLFPFAVSGGMIAAKPTITAKAVPVRTLVGTAVASTPSLSASATHTFPPRSLAAALAAPRPIIVAVADQDFPERAFSGDLWAKRPTIAGTMLKGASPGASHVAATVSLSGIIDLDVLYQGVVDSDVFLTGVIEL